ncbi:uncharacterized protein LOC135210403 [Macrobrachium nipponense]|uniref:uncharacterized protein LOC135210403 n=1 Tax=Macrobrachium nipponense TaxID=159736 RepID=UPI0030C7D5D1
MSLNSWLMKDTSPADFSRQSLTGFFFSITESLMTQESRVTPPYNAMRFTLLLWYIFSLIISALYSGMLTAVLVKPSFEKPVNSLSDLPYAVQNGFTLVVSADTSDYFLFKEATDGIYADTWKLFNQEDKAKSFPLNSDGSYNKILHDKQIFIRGEAAAIFITTRIGREQFHLAKETFAPQLYGMVFFTGAPFQATFNKMLSYMIEGGLVRKWRDDGFRKLKSKPTLTESSGHRAFTLSQLQAAYYVLLIGLISAVVALILENLFSYFNKLV